MDSNLDNRLNRLEQEHLDFDARHRQWVVDMEDILKKRDKLGLKTDLRIDRFVEESRARAAESEARLTRLETIVEKWFNRPPNGH